MRVHANNPVMTAFTCNDGTDISAHGRATDMWGSTAHAGGRPSAIAQHNFAWTSGMPASGECERDEYPPRYFWPKASKGLTDTNVQRIRMLPASENGGAGQSWARFCELTGKYGPYTKTKPKGSKRAKVTEALERYEVVNAASSSSVGADGTMSEFTPPPFPLNPAPGPEWLPFPRGRHAKVSQQS